MGELYLFYLTYENIQSDTVLILSGTQYIYLCNILIKSTNLSSSAVSAARSHHVRCCETCPQHHCSAHRHSVGQHFLSSYHQQLHKTVYFISYICITSYSFGENILLVITTNRCQLNKNQTSNATTYRYDGESQN